MFVRYYLLLADHSGRCVTPVIITNWAVESIPINHKDIAGAPSSASYQKDWTERFVTAANFLAGAQTLGASQ